MGMSIDEHITQLKKLKSFHNGSYGASISYAIDTMRKYQKIAEIVDEWKHDHDNLNYADDSYYWSKVREVIEDENDK